MIYSQIIPFSIYVILDLIRILQGKFIEWDLQLYDEKENLNTLVRTTNVNEDLGKIEYILTDKTGTLTTNKMKLKILMIGKELFGSHSMNLC